NSFGYVHVVQFLHLIILPFFISPFLYYFLACNILFSVCIALSFDKNLSSLEVVFSVLPSSFCTLTIFGSLYKTRCKRYKRVFPLPILCVSSSRNVSASASSLLTLTCAFSSSDFNVSSIEAFIASYSSF